MFYYRDKTWVQTFYFLSKYFCSYLYKFSHVTYMFSNAVVIMYHVQVDK